MSGVLPFVMDDVGGDSCRAGKVAVFDEGCGDGDNSGLVVSSSAGFVSGSGDSSGDGSASCCC